MSQERSLSKLKKGEQGIVAKVLEGASAIRLMEMGLVPGTRIQLSAISPFGDPIAVKVGSFSLSMRRKDAEQVVVK